MANCKKNSGYSCSNPTDCSQKGCRVDRDYNGVSDMNEIWSGKKQWRKEAKYESPSEETEGKKSDGPGVFGWIVIIVVGLYALGSCSTK